MGANGSKARGVLENPQEREYLINTILDISDNIKVIEAKRRNAKVKLPEESHTPGRIYVALNKPATEKTGQNDPFAGKMKSFAVYGADCKKLYEVHPDHVHGGMQVHYHPWKDGGPVRSGTGRHSPSVAFPLTPDMKKILELIYKKVPHV